MVIVSSASRGLDAFTSNSAIARGEPSKTTTKPSAGISPAVVKVNVTAVCSDSNSVVGSALTPTVGPPPPTTPSVTVKVAELALSSTV